MLKYPRASEKLKEKAYLCSTAFIPLTDIYYNIWHLWIIDTESSVSEQAVAYYFKLKSVYRTSFMGLNPGASDKS